MSGVSGLLITVCALVLLTGAVIYAMGSGDGSEPVPAVTVDTSDAERFPWTLQRRIGRGIYGRQVEGHYPTKAICEAKRKTLKNPHQWECRPRKS